MAKITNFKLSFCLQLTLILYWSVDPSDAIDTQMIQLLSLMETNEQIFVVFDQNRDPLNLEERSDRVKEYGSKLELGFTGYKLQANSTSVLTGGNIQKFSVYSMDSNRIKEDESILNPVRVVGRLSDVNDTVELISQIAESTIALQSILRNSWFLILWPEGSTNETNTEREKLLYQHLNTSTFIKSFSVSSQFYVGFFNGNNLTSSKVNDNSQLFQFYEAYGLDGKLFVQPVAGIGSAFFNCWSCPSFTKRRSNLYGALLLAEGLEDPEFQQDTIYTYNATSQEIKFTDGFSVRLLFILQRALNFTYKASIMTSALARGLGEASAWDGVVKRVEDGNVDFGVSLTVQIQSRARRIYFLPPTDEYILGAFFHPPSSQAIRDIFLQPFHLDLWAAVISTWLVLACSMILFSKIRQRVGAGEPGVEEPDFTQFSFIWALATACQQGWDDHPVAGSMRIIFISCSFSGVVAYAGYSAAIVSTLSLRVDPIQTPQALIDSSLKIGMHSGFLDFLLSYNKTEDIVSKVYRRLDESTKGRLNGTTGYDLVSQKSYAFLSIRDTFYDVITQSLNDKQICDIRDLRILKKGFPAGTFLSFNSPYKEYFRVVLIKTRERGVLWRLRDFFMYTRRCQASADNQGQALGPNDVFTAFMILLAGYVISLSFLFIEKIIFIKKLNYVQ